MQRLRFNGSDDSGEDETLFTRGRRPKRRRPTCPLNLRDVISDSGSSSEEIEPSDTPPSLLPPTPTFLDLSHNTAFHSRRSNDTLSSFTSPDIPGTNGDSILAPSASNSWLSSQDASGHIRQAPSEAKPPGTPSTSLTGQPSSEPNPLLRLSRYRSFTKSKDRQAALDKMKKKLERMKGSNLYWETSLPPSAIPQKDSLIILYRRPSFPRESHGSLRSNDIVKSASIRRPSTSSLPVHPAVPEVVPIPPLEPLGWRQKTLQRFLVAVGWTEDTLPGDFVDDVDISSDEAKDNWSAEDVDVQLDSEWLELSHTYIPNVEDTEVLERPKGGTARLKWTSTYPRKYLKTMLPINTAMLYLGRLPLGVDMSEDIPRFKCNKKSWRYFLFLWTSMMSFFTAFLMIGNYVVIATADDPLTLHETATQLDQGKYWIEATLEILNLLFLAASSVSMLEYGGGTSVVDFLNRWSAALAVTQYDVTSGLRTMTIGFFCCYGIYAATIVTLFFSLEKSIPTVRGSCGFTGLLILNGFKDQLRLRPAYRVVEFLGLFVHLYTTLASSLVTLLICLHCWALDNAAKRFNRRLAGCLRAVGFRRASQAYRKLFAEHLVVTSFPKQIGKVFRFTLIAYLGCKMAELVLTLFVVSEPIVNEFPLTDSDQLLNGSAKSHFDSGKHVPKLVPEPSYMYMVKCGLYFLRAWIPWLIFMEIVQKPGSSLMRGAGLIVRNYWRHSRTSHALRFITSMEFSFSSRIAFNLNPGMQLTREFTGKFMGFALVTVITLLQFIPSAVNPQSHVICDHLGGCALLRFPPKSKSHTAFAHTVQRSISDEQHATTQPPRPAPDLPPPIIFYSFPPSFPNGRLAVVPSNYAFECQEGSNVYIPTYFRRTIGGRYFQLPPTPDHSCVQSSSIPQGELLFDSFGDRVSAPLEADECGNPKLPTPDATGAKKLPILRAVRLNREIFCCFVYSGLENQAERCNLLSTGTHSCSRKSGTPDREIHEESIVQLWNVSSKAFAESQLVQWTECLCQGLYELPVSSSACIVPPGSTKEPTTTTKETSTTTTGQSTTEGTTSTTLRYLPEGPCPDSTPPKGACRNCPDPRSFFRKHFLASCPPDAHGHAFSFPSVAPLPDQGPMGEEGKLGEVLNYHYSPSGRKPCDIREEVISTRPKWKDPPHYDCYGNLVEVEKAYFVDDCGTQKVRFPSRYDGTKEMEPKLEVVRLNEESEKTLEFLCCWNYKEWEDEAVNSTCNTYPGSKIYNVCSIRTAKTETEAKKACREIIDGVKGKAGKLNELYRKKCASERVCSI